MLSDWHVGTGSGRPGDVDRLVVRDADRLPYLPAKTVNGLWRDSCEIAARALDRGDAAGPWSRWVNVAFGSQPGLADRSTAGEPDDQSDAAPSAGMPRPAAVQVRSARYSPAVRAAVRTDADLRRAMTFLKPGVKIDGGTGRAERGMLRFEEQTRIGAVLHGTFRLDPDLVEDAGARRLVTALLLAGGRLLEQVGGKRRRGNGRCEFVIDSDLSLDSWWRWLPTATPPDLPPRALPRRVLGVPADAADRASPGGGWEIAQLRIVLDEPVVAGPRVLGNDVVGQDRIPGGTLLPAVLAKLGQPAADALLDGNLLVTSATVEIDGEPGRPTPRTFAELKDAVLLEDLGGIEDGDSLRLAVNRAKIAAHGVKPLKTGYVPATAIPASVVRSARPVRRVLPSLVVRMHNSIDDTAQRPTRDAGGGVYTYRALPAGTVLRAEVRVRAGVLPAGWVSSLSGQYSIGVSRKDDYGRASVTATVGSPPKPPPLKGRRLTVWLVSDMVLSDARLQPSADPQVLRCVLERALRLSPGALELVLEGERDGETGRELIPTVVATWRTESWQARWGLPRASLCGIAAGSVATFNIADGVELDPDALAQVHVEGLGERRGEGFGQVLVAVEGGTENQQNLVTSFTTGRLETRENSIESVDSAAVASASDTELIAALRVEALRTGIHETAAVVASTSRGRESVLGRGADTVPSTQLAVLREVLPTSDGDAAERNAQLDRLVKHFDKKWPLEVRATIKELFTKPDRVWAVLAEANRLGEGKGRPAADSRDGSGDPAVTAEPRARLWHEAVQAVVITSLTALRRDQEATPSQGSARPTTEVR